MNALTVRYLKAQSAKHRKWAKEHHAAAYGTTKHEEYTYHVRERDLHEAAADALDGAARAFMCNTAGEILEFCKQLEKQLPVEE